MPTVDPITQSEIGDLVEDAFFTSTPAVEDLLRAARRAGASSAVLSRLHALPDRLYSSVLDVWSELEELPFSRHR